VEIKLRLVSALL